MTGDSTGRKRGQVGVAVPEITPEYEHTYPKSLTEWMNRMNEETGT